MIVCDTSCGVTANWLTVDDAVPYPPTGTAPYLAGSYSCRPPAPVSASTGARQCRVRMQFVDGAGNLSILSGAVVGNEHF